MPKINVFFHKLVRIPVRVGKMSAARQEISLVQNDTGPHLQFTIKDCDGNVISSNVSGVHFHIRQYCGAKVNEGHTATSGVDVANGVWAYDIQPGDLSGTGIHYGDLEIVYDNGSRETGLAAVRMFVRESNK